MGTKEKIRKLDRKSRLTQVKMQIIETMLQPCKASQGNSAGKNTKWYGYSSLQNYSWDIGDAGYFVLLFGIRLPCSSSSAKKTRTV
jgi:hypothetical protein